VWLSGALSLRTPSPIPAVSAYRIVRDDGQSDGIAGQCFASYDEAYAVLERYYVDLCCSDEREYYRIEEETG
jgi:hypothetical protein